MKHILTGLAVCVALGGSAKGQSSIEPWLALSADGHFDDYLPGGGEGFVARVAPGAGVRLHTPRLSLRLEGSAAYDRYEGTHLSVPDSWNVLFRARMDYRATRRLTLHVSDTFTDARDPREIDRVGVVTPPGVDIIDNIADATVEYAVFHAVALDAGYVFRVTRFGDVGGIPTPGGDEHDLAGGTSFKLTAQDTLRAGWRTQWFVIGQTAKAHTPSLSLAHKLSRITTVTVEGGPIVYDSPGSGLAATWHARAGLLADWPHLRIMADYDRELVGGTGAAPIIWANFVAGTVRYRTQRWLDFQLRGDYFRNGLAPDSTMLVDGYDFWVELVFRLRRGFELSGYYAFRQQFDHEMGGFLGLRRDLVGIRLTAVLAPSARMTQEVQ
jgi:hypothetical protein